MAGETLTLDRFGPLVDEAIMAIRDDFRISEALARQAVSLQARRESKVTKTPTR